MQTTQKLPEGVIHERHTMDGEYIRTFYRDGKYYLENRFQYFGKADSIELIELMIEACNYYDFNQTKTVCQWVQKENKRVQPLYSVRGMEWTTPACRFNYVLRCVHNRMDRLRPITTKHVTRWVSVNA